MEQHSLFSEQLAFFGRPGGLVKPLCDKPVLELTAAGPLLSSLMWYVTLATVAWAVLFERAVRHRYVIAGCLTVGLVTLAEAARIFSTTHSADVPEPLLALFAWVGASAACQWIDRQRRVDPQAVIRDLL